MAQWVERRTVNQTARIRIPANTNGFFLSVFSGFFLGSILGTEVSPVRQDTDEAPDIGRANHDYI